MKTITLLLFSFIFIFSFSKAQVTTTSDCLPPLDTIDAYTSQYHVQALAGLISLEDVIHYGFGNCTPPPDSISDSQVDTFWSFISGNLSVDYGNTFTPVLAPANTSVTVQLTNINGSTRTFNTEMIKLDISGGNLPAGYMVRESPTLHSYGLTTIVAKADVFEITSYFDINIELSNNYGAFWIPADTIAHVELSYKNNTSIGEQQVLNESVKVFPNPFIDESTIDFNVENSGNTLLEVYNLDGKKVATLFNGFAESQKNYSVKMNGKNLAAGIYFYKLSTADGLKVGKVVKEK